FAMLLLNKSVPLFERDKKSFAFLFDMNVLFEKFIGRIIKDIYKDVEIPKKAKSFEELHLKPDIIVNSENLIIDCKYKVIQDGKIASREDRYQMYVYANNFKNIDTTMLLYPKHFNHNKDLDKKLILGENDKKVTLFMKSIDLELDGGCSYSEYIKELQNRVEKLQWN
ncbi:MAG: restriction endonuclease, partial [Campylobacterota bacterium]|nr:restriction endonuclease [Campylobacterota bacterium]